MLTKNVGKAFAKTVKWAYWLCFGFFVLFLIFISLIIFLFSFSSLFEKTHGPFHNVAIIDVIHDSNVIVSSYNNEKFYCKRGDIISIDNEKKIETKKSIHTLLVDGKKMYGISYPSHVRDDETFVFDENFNVVESFDDPIDVIYDNKAYFYNAEYPEPIISRWDLSTGLRDDFSIPINKANTFYTIGERRVFVNKYSKLFIDSEENNRVFLSYAEDDYPYKVMLFWGEQSYMVDDNNVYVELLCDEVTDGYIYFSVTKRHHNKNCLAWKFSQNCICDFETSEIIKMDATTKEQTIVSTLEVGEIPLRILNDKIIYYHDGSIYQDDVLIKETYIIKTGENYYCKGNINNNTGMKIKGNVHYLYCDGANVNQFALPY